MNETRQILHAWRPSARPRPAALATLVAARGASFRRPGAQLLVDASGGFTGNLSAGCIEGDIAVAGLKTAAAGGAALVTVTTGDDNEIFLGYGTGCDGQIKVLVESASTPHVHALRRAMERCVELRQPALIATIYGSSDTGRLPDGSRLIATADGAVETSCGHAAFDAVLGSALYSLPAGAAISRDFAIESVTFSALLQHALPPQRLVVFGAGPVSEAVARLGSEAGWDVDVVDRRPAMANQERFQQAHAVFCADYDALPQSVSPAPGDFCLIATHNFLDDAVLLQRLLDTDAAIVGVLGSRKRFNQLVDEMAAAGRPIAGADRARLRAPAGLDIGAETPAQIAISVLAELFAAAQSRTGQPLSFSDGAIHGVLREGAGNDVQ